MQVASLNSFKAFSAQANNAQASLMNNSSLASKMSEMNVKNNLVRNQLGDSLALNCHCP